MRIESFDDCMQELFKGRYIPEKIRGMTESSNTIADLGYDSLDSMDLIWDAEVAFNCVISMKNTVHYTLGELHQAVLTAKRNAGETS